MKNYILGTITVLTVALYLGITSFKFAPSRVKTEEPTSETIYIQYINQMYNAIHLNESNLSFSVFEKAVTGFYNLKKAGQLGNKSILTIADFDQASTKKRFYIIDLDKKTVLLNTWVAHGQKSGEDDAVNFSNTNNSFSSSLGFYVTGEVYYGTHGKSLKLDGMDEGFNDNARNRSIVVHGANYVSEGTINALGRLGRSQGCPAVAPEVTDKVIATISNKTVLFINKTTDKYSSRYLDHQLAYGFIANQLQFPFNNSMN